jgi:hypothetical protein
VVACVPDSPVFLVIVSNVVASSDHVTSFFLIGMFWEEGGYMVRNLLLPIGMS